MRRISFLLGLTAFAAFFALNAAAAFPDKVVYLDGAADLARLRTTNPEHAARAERIMAAANELCRPQPGAISYARWAYAGFQARAISCSDMLVRTSLPPKRQIDFTLDDTRYIALVVITDDPARPIRVH